MDAKRCYTCGKYKAGIYFASMEKNCMECVADLKEAAKLRSLDHSYQTRYGMTLDDYNDMFDKQNGRCAICDTHQMKLKSKLFVDHCHETGQIRALLCNKCNSMLGGLESPMRDKGDAYIKRHKALND